MQISSRFTIALHIFACVEVFKEKQRLTSSFLSQSIHTNPVIIRNILLQLKRAGLIEVARGSGGITVEKPLSDITFYDVYEAIEPLENGSLFHFHEAPDPKCPVGRNIHTLLDDKLNNIQKAMEEKMKAYTLADLSDDMRQILKKEGEEYGNERLS
ncbi:MAG: Rrf2 family transcriptional regulator [Erysipelotrichaceae bacterium]|nr:Rrf2 family transcriptional regulator [Erysipelotrichaceae bacterium]